MSLKQTLAVAVAVIAGLVLCAAGIGGTGMGVGGDAGACTPATASSLSPAFAPAGSTFPPTGPVVPVSGFDTKQVAHAQVIVSVGARLSVPRRGWVIAVATAMQESGLRNLPGGDRDSVGLFQQRPSQGWGTVAQLRDPTYAATMFYQRLHQVPGWQQVPLTVAAQAVQRSAFPDAYARHEPEATRLVTTLASAVVPGCAPLGPLGWTQPVHAVVVSGFRTSDRPAHDGADLGAPRGTVIRAAAAGRVTIVTCNVVPASHGCDRDRSPQLLGCGWYLDLDHGAGVMTRYCHLAARPQVTEGQHVVAGQPLGHVGSSGNSSGPHLHFETWVGGVPVDPARFMAVRGAPLGQAP